MARYTYQSETIGETCKIGSGTVAEASQKLGIDNAEPLLVCMDSLLRYAKAHRKAYDCPVGEDGVLGESYAQAIAGIRGLLNGDGAVAMEKGITTDSKDNGVIETLFWACCKEAGLDGNNL